MRYFIPLLINHYNREALIARVFRQLARNFSGVSPRGFDVQTFLSLLILERTAI
jgi:hypothetical protein